MIHTDFISRMKAEINRQIMKSRNPISVNSCEQLFDLVWERYPKTPVWKYGFCHSIAFSHFEILIKVGLEFASFVNFSFQFENCSDAIRLFLDDEYLVSSEIVRIGSSVMSSISICTFETNDRNKIQNILFSFSFSFPLEFKSFIFDNFVFFV